MYATVVRDLFASLDVDSIASKRTFKRLMGQDPPDEPPDDKLGDDLIVLGGDDDEENDIAASADHKDDDVAAFEDHEEEDNAASASPQIYQSPRMTLKEWRKIPKFGQIRNVSVYETSPGDCSISDGDDDDDYDDLHDDSQYQNESSEDLHCQFCFLSGHPIKVTFSHKDLDIACPFLSDVDRRRIHGDRETDRWLA